MTNKVITQDYSVIRGDYFASLKAALDKAFTKVPYVYENRPPFHTAPHPCRDGGKGASRKQSRATVRCPVHAVSRVRGRGLAPATAAGLVCGGFCPVAGAGSAPVFPPRLGVLQLPR